MSVLQPGKVAVASRVCYSIAARLGTPVQPSVLVALRNEYATVGRNMHLSMSKVHRVELLPGGSLAALCDLALSAQQRAQKLCKLGTVSTMMDISRSPAGAMFVVEQVPMSEPVRLVPSHKNDREGMSRLLGRPTVLSHMMSFLPRRVFANALPATSDSPHVLAKGDVDRVLAAVQLRPPTVDVDAGETSTDDDIALAICLAAWLAQEAIPSPLANVADIGGRVLA